MKRIYLAGKLNDQAVGYIKNVSLMLKAAIDIRKLGHSVFVPCQDVLMGIVDGDLDYADYADNNMAWLEVSDEVWVLPNYKTSKGTLKEMERAVELNIPIVFYGESN